MTDSDKLRGVADWMNSKNIAALEWPEIEEAVTPTDLGRIADQLEKGAPSDGEIHAAAVKAQTEATKDLPWDFNLISWKEGAKWMRERMNRI